MASGLGSIANIVGGASGGATSAQGLSGGISSGFSSGAKALALNAISQGMAFGLNARSASQSWDRQKNWATRGPSYVMTGLRNAGLNPILAAGSGISSGASRAPQAAPAAPGGQGTGISLAGAQRDLLKSQTNASNQMADKAEADKNLSEVRNFIESLDIPRKSAVARVFQDSSNDHIIRDQEINQALPNTAVGLGAKQVYGSSSNPSYPAEVEALIKGAANAPQALIKWLRDNYDRKYNADRTD